MKVLLITLLYNKTAGSSFFKPNNFLMLLALFGPNLLGLLSSVNPGISASPLPVTVKNKALISSQHLGIVDLVPASGGVVSRTKVCDDLGFHRVHVRRDEHGL